MDRHSTARNPERAPAGSGVYRFLRWLVRLWLTLFFRTIRLLNADAMPDSSAAVLAINHAAGFFEALILVATFEREVRCLLARGRVPGLAHGLLARGLRMILYDAEGDGWRPRRGVFRRSRVRHADQSTDVVAVVRARRSWVMVALCTDRCEPVAAHRRI